MMKKITKKDGWFISTILLSVILLVAEVISDNLIGDGDVTGTTKKTVAGFVTLLSIPTFIVCIITVFKTEEKKRNIAIFLSLASLIIFGLAGFAYGFLGYGDLH